MVYLWAYLFGVESAGDEVVHILREGGTLILGQM